MPLESLLFSLHATTPVFLLIVLGWLLQQIGLLNQAFCQVSDKLVFYVALPIMLFSDMATNNIRAHFDPAYVLFCAVVTSFIFFTLWICAKFFLRDKTLVGEFVQVSYRSSAAILGCAIIKGIYGTTGMAPLMILGSVPLFNLYAVLVLSLEGPQAKDDTLRHRLQSALVKVATNPIILGIALGLIASIIGISNFPPIIQQTFDNLSSLATPLALLSIGASFQGKKALRQIRLTSVATIIKLLILPALFLPLAIQFGFSDSKLVALVVMLGSTSTPTCYIMARNLGHEGSLSISVIVLTTVLSAFTLTFWIFIIRYLGYLT